MRNVLSGILFALSCAVSLAQSVTPATELAEKKKIAQQIMALSASPTDNFKVVDGIISTIRKTMIQDFGKKNPQLNDQQIKRATDLYVAAMDKSITRFTLELLPKMADETAAAYAEKFSLSELSAIYGFRNSEVGRKEQQFTNQEIPELIKPLMAVSQQIGRESGESFMRIRQQLAQEGIVLK